MAVNIIFVGPPGSGKGTQGSILSKKYQIPVISTGDILRKEVSEKTDLGLKVASFMEQGILVPDIFILAIVENTLNSIDRKNGFILDGFPRSMEQAVYLNDIFKKIDIFLTGVFYFDLKESLLIERLLKRAELEGRTDDTLPVIKNRLIVFREKTAPLLTYYSDLNLLTKIDTDTSIETVTNSIVNGIFR